jgi:hypothetical protein
MRVRVCRSNAMSVLLWRVPGDGPIITRRLLNVNSFWYGCVMEHRKLLEWLVTVTIWAAVTVIVLALLGWLACLARTDPQSGYGPSPVVAPVKVVNHSKRAVAGPDEVRFCCGAI